MAHVPRMGPWYSHVRRAIGWRLLFVALAAGALLIAGCAPMAAPTGAPKAARPSLTLAVMGASDAWGIGTRDPDRLNWPTFLAADLPGTAHLINLGVPGSTLAASLRQQAPVVLGERPDALVIWLAVNDIIDHTSLTAYRSDLRDLLASVRTQSPHTLVFVGDVPDLSQLPYFSGWDQATLRAEVTTWNAAISQVCAAEGATVVDLYSVWGQIAEHPEYVSDDGLHPSTRGADALAVVFAIAIEQRLETAQR